MPIDNNVGSRIQKARIAAGMNQAALAEALGIGKSSMSEWESGKRGIAIDAISEIAAILKVSELYLLGLDTPTQSMTMMELDDSEIALIRAYRNLDEYGQAAVRALMDVEAKRPYLSREKPTSASVQPKHLTEEEMNAFREQVREAGDANAG